jgi:OOP family OmpA-OmpF porin
MKKWLKFILCVISIAAFLGCGVKQVTPLFEAPDLSMKLKSGDYTQKVDNFLILLDASHSMRDIYRDEQKFYLAKQAAHALNDTIAGLKLTGGIRLFGNLKVFSANTSLVCPMKDYSADDFGQCLDNLNPSFGSTPLYKALRAAAGDIENLQGKTAIIIISDGASTGKAPTEAVNKLKDRFGDKVCISTIGIAGSGDLNSISSASKCGVAMSFENVNTAAGMEMFAEKVFLAMKPKPAPKPVVEEVIIIPQQVFFDFDSSVIKPEFAVVLEEEAAKILRQKEHKGIIIEGHTDSIGTVEYNQLLSERRSNAIKELLVSKGLSASILTAKGVGEEKPIADNTTKEGRAQNRRVEFHVLH